MRAALALCVVLAGCAARLDAPNACSDPLGLYTSPSYEFCCRAHDVAYTVGGDESDRLTADKALYSCVRDRGSESDAASMFYAVRLGGRDRFHYRKD
jgi:hypothetical protein